MLGGKALRHADPRFHAELREHPGEMPFHGLAAQEQPGRDLLVGQPDRLIDKTGFA
jgi:hypothetical protein